MTAVTVVLADPHPSLTNPAKLAGFVERAMAEAGVVVTVEFEQDGRRYRFRDVEGAWEILPV